MLKVYKYGFTVADFFELSMPEGARILHAAGQSGELYLWALVNPLNPPEIRKFRLAGTAHEIYDEPLNYIGSLSLFNKTLSFHLFERLL